MRTLSKLFLALFLLLLLVIGSLAFNALSNFYAYQQKVDPKMRLSFEHFAFLFEIELKEQYLRLKAPKPLSDEASPLKTFHITAKEDDLARLNEDLPWSGKEGFINAYMKVSDSPKIRKIKLRYRGDKNSHWLYEQKSLRIKLSKEETYNMEQTFNLINPPHWYSFRDVIAYDLAKQLNLIAPDYEPVRVILNGQYMGVYIYLSQVDESLLRKHRIMPGSIYSGDDAPNNSEGIADLWFHEKYWQKKAARNLEQKANREDIQLFIKAINDYNDTAFVEFLETFCDKEKILTFVALDRFFGGNHHDYLHNIKLYFDPYKGKFELVMWDLRNWSDMPRKDLSLNPLVLRIKQNPMLDNEVDKIVYRLMRDTALIAKIEADYQEVITRTLRDFESDIFKDSAELYPDLFKIFYSVPFSIEELIEWHKYDIWVFSKRRDYLHKRFEETQISYQQDGTNLTFYVYGNSGVKVDFSQLQSHTVWLNGKEVNAELTLYPGRVLVKEAQTLFPIRQYGRDLVKNAHNVYEFTLLPKENTPLELEKIRFYNSITNTALTANAITQAPSGLQPFSNPEPPHPKEVFLEGEIEVTQERVFDKHTTVHIAAGTRFVMEHNCSIYFYGKVLALGTQEQPIRFEAKNQHKPWGLVAVQGQASSGSKFHYCHFENGSVDSRNLIHYTAPFNLHDLHDFEVKHCFIGKNHIGDDAMHIAYATGSVENSVFEGARSDGLDIDIAKVVIRNNSFKNCGNDGLDIMTTQMEASNNTFFNTGDKGISVGEWSEANISQSLFSHTGIGLEIKDKSTVIAKDLHFLHSKEVDINLYHKNKRYDKGGSLTLLNGKANIRADKASEVLVYE